MTDIYQTLEERGNDNEVEEHGPYFCSLNDEEGRPRNGIREPWLGEGYYFWDSRKGDAEWWGMQHPEWDGYIVCHTSYDQHSPLLFDMLGEISHFDEFIACAEIVKKERNEETVSFPVVLAYLKSRPEFNYKAVRVWPDPINATTNSSIGVFFPGEKAFIKVLEKVQICFFDKTLLTQPFTIIEKRKLRQNFTI